MERRETQGQGKRDQGNQSGQSRQLQRRKTQWQEAKTTRSKTREDYSKIRKQGMNHKTGKQGQIMTKSSSL